MGNTMIPELITQGAICTFLGRSIIFLINQETQPREAMEEEEEGLMNDVGGNSSRFFLPHQDTHLLNLCKSFSFLTGKRVDQETKKSMLHTD